MVQQQRFIDIAYKEMYIKYENNFYNINRPKINYDLKKSSSICKQCLLIPQGKKERKIISMTLVYFLFLINLF